LAAGSITTGILAAARGGLGKALVPTWTDNYIIVYKTATDDFRMEAKPAGAAVNIPLCLFCSTFSTGAGAGVNAFYPLAGNRYDTTEARSQCHVPAGTFKKLKVHLATGLAATMSLEVTLRKNGAASTLTLDLSGQPGGDYEISSDVSAVAADHFDVQVLTLNEGAGAVTHYLTVSLEFQPS